MEKQFVHLHVHTEYSLLDGATRIDKLFKRCDELGMPAVAITDHGNMYGALKFVKAAISHTDHDADVFRFLAEKQEFKVKPIIGCELYLTEDMSVKVASGGKMPKNNHIVLLAKNLTGYKNLVKLTSLAYVDGLYYKPRTDFEHLKQYSEGLICLSACLAGELPQAILRGDYDKADEIVEKYKAVFGDDYYIEIQDHNIRDQKTVLPHLISIARKHGVKIVATNDVHYLNKKDAFAQKVLQCISFRTTMSPDELNDSENSLTDETLDDGGYFPTKEFYLKSAEEMAQTFPGLDDALSNTLEIADKCEPYFFSKEPLMPAYVPEDGSAPYDFLRKLTYDGLAKKYGEITDKIRERADYELGVISKMGFVDYFLIVWDFINWSETHGVPVGPGRGSGAGSIVAYAVGITKIDPIKYDLIFERFLNPERVSNPDFDIDFCVDGRERTIEYVVNKYGEPNVSQIVTFGTLAAKAAIKDVGRVFNQPFAEVDKITKLMPKMMGKNHIGHLIGLEKPKKPDDPSPVVPDLKELYENDPMVKRIIDVAREIEGMPRQTGMHAAGVIICRDPIADHVPMARSGEDIVTTQFDMIECEELGLLKMDFLGLRTVTDIHKALKYVKQTRGIDLDFYSPSMDYEDQKTFKMIGEGDTHAVFQLESGGMKDFMKKLQPSALEEIIAGISLYRPGPMDYIPDYIRNKNAPDKIIYDHDLLIPTLNVTYGIMVYQEQVMRIVQDIAGYSLGRADEVRRMMSKKKHDKMAKEREVFIHGLHNDRVNIPGAVANGVSEEVAIKIYADMSKFASYAFNKSHAAAYTYLTYQTAYLKCYYTVEFICAVLNNRITNIEEISNYLGYLKEHGFEVKPPSINRSVAEFSVEDGAVRIGMAAIKNVGIDAIENIVEEREKNGDFVDFESFVKRMGDKVPNKKQLQSLIYAGTFDCFGLTRSQLMAGYESVVDRAAHDRAKGASGQISIFDTLLGGGGGATDFDKFEWPKLKEYELGEKLAYEKEVAGVYLTGHPLDQYKEHLKKFERNTAMLGEKVTHTNEDGESTEDFLIEDDSFITLGGMIVEAEKKISKKNGREFGVGRLEDLYGSVELMLSGFKYNQYRDLFVKDKLVSVSGRIRRREEGATLSVDRIESWDSSTKSSSRKICFYISFSKQDSSIVDMIFNILKAYPGNDKAYIKNTDTGQIMAIGGIGTKIDTTMYNELCGILGEENIKIAD